MWNNYPRDDSSILFPQRNRWKDLTFAFFFFFHAGKIEGPSVRHTIGSTAFWSWHHHQSQSVDEIKQNTYGNCYSRDIQAMTMDCHSLLKTRGRYSVIVVVMVLVVVFVNVPPRKDKIFKKAMNEGFGRYQMPTSSTTKREARRFKEKKIVIVIIMWWSMECFTAIDSFHWFIPLIHNYTGAASGNSSSCGVSMDSTGDTPAW